MDAQLMLSYLIPLILALVQVFTLARQYKLTHAEKKQMEGKAKADEGDAVESIAQAAAATAGAQTNTIAALSKRIDDLEKRIGAQDKKINSLTHTVQVYARRVVYLMGGIDQLIRQLTDMKTAPVWTPDEWDPNDCDQ